MIDIIVLQRYTFFNFFARLLRKKILFSLYFLSLSHCSTELASELQNLQQLFQRTDFIVYGNVSRIFRKTVKVSSIKAELLST